MQLIIYVFTYLYNLSVKLFDTNKKSNYISLLTKKGNTVRNKLMTYYVRIKYYF